MSEPNPRALLSFLEAAAEDPNTVHHLDDDPAGALHDGGVGWATADDVRELLDLAGDLVSTAVHDVAAPLEFRLDPIELGPIDEPIAPDEFAPAADAAAAADVDPDLGDLTGQTRIVPGFGAGALSLVEEDHDTDGDDDQDDGDDLDAGFDDHPAWHDDTAWEPEAADGAGDDHAWLGHDVPDGFDDVDDLDDV